MKSLLSIIILSLLGLCYTYSLCDSEENSTNGMGESINQNETCIRLYGNNRQPKPRGPSGKRNKPTDRIDPKQSAKKGIRELVDMGEIGRFSVKHMYMDGRFGSGINSFDELAGNPERLRNYLVELNRRMFKNNILPVTISGRETFQNWITKRTNNPQKISLVDADLGQLQEDIGAQPEFRDYLEIVKRNPQNAMKNLFTTTRKHFVTEIILAMEGDKLTVKLERYTAKLKIGMKSSEIYHWDPFDRSVIQKKVNGRTVTYVDVESTSSVEHEKTQTTFTHEQLVENEKLTLDFWKELFEVPDVDMVGYRGPINEQAKRFSRVELKYRREWQNKVVDSGNEIPRQEKVLREIPGSCPSGHNGRGCALFIDTEGNVESIQPEEFVKVFKNMREEERKVMLEKVKNNGDKFTVNNEITAEEARRQLNQLVHHDELQEHIELVDLTGTVQDLSRWQNKETKVPSTVSELVTSIHDRISARLDKVRLSGAKIVDSLAKHPDIENINKAGKVYGHLMVAKGIINGIIHNDTTSLAIIGSRFGYDIVTEGAVKIGEKFFTAASKLGKAARVLSKVAGPIGAVVDVGLGAWSLSKSVDRLKKADNKYDRDEAIADIVSESIDMAVTVTVTVLSIAFPPAAPILAAVGFIISLANNIANSLFHAGNEVARINAEIPLSGREKAEVFSSRFRDIFGLREKDYIDFLVEEKKANDLAVTNYLGFLKNNTQFSGVVFPSRTLAYEGSCRLIRYDDCFTGSWVGRPLCHKKIVGTGCDWNEPCGGRRRCMNETTRLRIYDCICDGEERTDFGFPHKNSVVDFRAQQNVYWERAVPGDVPEAEFKCKPGSLRFINHKISQSQPKNDYHCVNAIGLYRPKKERKADQSFLVDLQDGNDEVFVDRKVDETAYTFLMGDEGYKNFYGGKSKNDFILGGNCSSGLLNGTLNGGPMESDSLIIASTCAKGHTIEVKKDGKFYYAKLQNKLNLRLEEIENIVGRPNEAESVEVGCNTRSVFLNGGANSKNPDSISIDPLLTCPIDLQTWLGNYTNILFQARRGKVTIYVGEDITGSTIHFKQPLKDSNGILPTLPTTTVIFTQIKSQDIILDDIKVTGNDVSLKLKDHTRLEPLTIKYSSDKARPVNQHQLFFNESSVDTPNTFSVLLVPGNENAAKNSALMFFHDLRPHTSRNKHIKRSGSDTIPNLFNVSARNWDVRGGVKDDTFLLNVPWNQVKLDGGEGVNTLVIESSQNVAINLNQGEGIQTVVKGNNAGPIEISTSCETKAIAIKGGKSPDIVKINFCSEKRDLQIDAGGLTRVLVEGDIEGENENVQILVHQVGKERVTFELDTMGNKVSRLSVQIPLESNIKELYVHESGRSSEDIRSFRVHLKGAVLDDVILKLSDNDRDDSPYISSPQIQLISQKQKTDQKPVQLVFKRDTLEPVVIHHVRYGQLRDVVSGFGKMENLFQLNENTSLRNVHGGKLKDTFIGTSHALSFVQLHGFPESDNTLIVKDDTLNSLESQTTFKIDLPANLMGLLLADSSRKASIDGHYHHLVGRANQPDTIVATCTTKSIAGRGGSSKDKLDLIEFKANEFEGNKDCTPNMEVFIAPFTKVENQAEAGIFKYYVDLTQFADDLSLGIHSNEHISNNIVFTLPPLDKTPIVAVHSIEFDNDKKSLTFTLKDRTTRRAVYEFSMYRQNEGNEFSDPQFLFTTADNWVTSDVRVDKDGIVIATYQMNGDCSKDHNNKGVKGMPAVINSFLVNMTGSGSSGSCGKVEGHIGSADNHFWLYQLPAHKRFRIVGSDKFYSQENGGSSNTLHVDQNFYSNKPLTAYFGTERSSLDIEGVLKVDLEWIENFAGRNNPNSYDIVIPSCSTNQVSGVDLVKILLNPRDDCIYHLLIEVQPMTRVEFEWMEDENDERRKNMVNFWNSTFYYRFSKPMSFEVVQSYPGMLDSTVHNFYLPFKIDDLETLQFDVDESKLRYTISSEEYSITMLTEPDDEDQFYPQPNMVTSDGFRIQIGRDGSVLVSKFLDGVQPKPVELLSEFQDIANTLVITMVIQTKTAFLHIGNDALASDRNVLQNLASNVSYLGGGGADDIYEVISLNKDVYIATGLENGKLPPAVNAEGPYIAKQTIDLSDIVAPISFKRGRKYKPIVVQEGDDLIIIIDGYQSEHPGRVIIYNGAKENVRKNLQILLSNAMMEFVKLHEHSWELSPVDAHLERQTVYSIAAEDLEHNHRIIVLDHKYGPEYRFGFKFSKKDEDLQLSDIEEYRGHKYDLQHIEMTTVIITDFFKVVPPHMNSDSDSYDAPTEIRNVTMFMPGLMIKLNGTDVHHYFMNENDGDYISPNSPLLVPVVDMPDWSSVIRYLENDVLEGVPFVNRTLQ